MTMQPHEIREYIQHKPMCPRHLNVTLDFGPGWVTQSEVKPCTCGLDDVLAALARAEQTIRAQQEQNDQVSRVDMPGSPNDSLTASENRGFVNRFDKEGDDVPQPDKDQLIEQMLQRERFERQGGGSVSTPMPRYKCHKEVWALKIADVVDPTAPGNESDGTRLIVPAEAGYAAFRVSHDYVQKHKPEAGGYYVVYADGYTSFSPASAFEEGYARI